MKKFMNFLKRHGKKISLVAGVTTVVALSAVAVSAWGPDRPTYTVEHPADHITFNSITNNPNVGDERNFVVVKDAANQNSGGWQDDINVQPGKEYLVRIYAHNNAASSLNLTAVNTRVSASVPTTTGKKVPISGFVSADNASPQQVWDDISLNSTQDFNVAYVAGSARIYNNGYASGGNGQALPDSIVTAAGAPIGYNGPNGRVPGCFQYANYITFKVKPQFAPAPNYSISKEVRVKGSNTWSHNVTARAGQEVEWRMQFQNTGATQLNNIAVVDRTPAHTTSVARSVQIYDANRPNGYTFGDDAIQGNLVNINIGNYGAHSNAWIYFNSKIDSEDKLPCGETSLVNNVYATPSGQPTVTANATVKVNRECQPNTPNFEIVKDVRKLGDTEWKQDVTVEYGDTVQYRIVVRNTGDTDLKNVVVKDNRPTGVDFVNGTLKVNGQTSSQDLFGSGVTVPEIKKGEQAEITFDAKVNQGETGACEVKKFHNIASAKPEGLEPKEDDADVNTKCNVAPAYACEALDVADLGNNSYRFSVRVKTEGGATVNKYIYNFGDATEELNTDKSVVEHQYAKPGQYSVVARVLFNVGNEQKEARCTAQVVVPEVPTTPPTTPNTPVKSIPSTGPAEVVAGIFGTSATAYGVMSLVESRRALKNVK